MAVWMVGRDGIGGPHTFGPFSTHADAEEYVETARKNFAESGYIGHPGFVYDAVANRKSNCGPWMP